MKTTNEQRNDFPVLESIMTNDREKIGWLYRDSNQKLQNVQIIHRTFQISAKNPIQTNPTSSNNDQLH